MGYYYCKPRPCDARTPNVVLILVLALILLCAPKLFSREEEEETNSTSPFVALILLVLILLVLSLLGTSRRKVSVKPPYCQCIQQLLLLIPSNSMAYGRSRTSSALDGFTLNPLPYPVLLVLALIFLFFAISWYFTYEEVVETAEKQFGWVLFATPVVLILIVRWLSSMENSNWFSASLPWESRMRTHQGPSEGSSPWGVAALILVLLIMVQYQSNFLDSWFV
ncbi:unnamed protein product [Sphenostylis stenocarpa]|uniref:Uncharacterized protein n=1 Tax=Sphenostylis stenocarpa TaxID=92480 RepID=A0AA86RXV5_9FABA|nr:unnamed protein product [Sphenostylis stenocarpa]